MRKCAHWSQTAVNRQHRPVFQTHLFKNQLTHLWHSGVTTGRTFCPDDMNVQWPEGNPSLAPIILTLRWDGKLDRLKGAPGTTLISTNIIPAHSRIPAPWEVYTGASGDLRYLLFYILNITLSSLHVGWRQAPCDDQPGKIMDGLADGWKKVTFNHINK